MSDTFMIVTGSITLSGTSSFATTSSYALSSNSTPKAIGILQYTESFAGHVNYFQTCSLYNGMEVASLSSGNITYLVVPTSGLYKLYANVTGECDGAGQARIRGLRANDSSNTGTSGLIIAAAGTGEGGHANCTNGSFVSVEYLNAGDSMSIALTSNSLAGTVIYFSQFMLEQL